MTLTDSHESSDAVIVLTKAEAADMLRVSVRTIDRYIADGTLGSKRISPRATRIPRADVEALISGAA